jgi:hypothetical protein
MGDTSGCQINSNNLAVYLQGVSVTPSSNLTSEYFVTASLPSSASLRRVWQFTTQGTITGPDTATLTLDYTQAHINCPDYNITFEGALNGLLTIHNQVFSANKFMSYTLTSAYVIVLSIKIPKAILECFGPGKTQNYSFSVFVNDGATTTTLSFNYTTNNSLTATIPGTTSSGINCTYSSSQQYYYGGEYTDPSGTSVYTGYLQITGTTSCAALTTLYIDVSGFPNPSSSFVALLGIEFDNAYSNPTILDLNWTDASGSFSQSLSLPNVDNAYYGFILVYNNSTASSTPWSVQTFSATPFYLITCIYGTNSGQNINIYDANRNFLYQSQSGYTSGVTITPQYSFTGPVYISFPTSPFSTNSVVFGGPGEFNTVYLTNPSTGLYQGSFNVGTQGIYLYYCTNTSGNELWQTSTCSS